MVVCGQCAMCDVTGHTPPPQPECHSLHSTLSSRLLANALGKYSLHAQTTTSKTMSRGLSLRSQHADRLTAQQHQDSPVRQDKRRIQRLQTAAPCSSIAAGVSGARSTERRAEKDDNSRSCVFIPISFSVWRSREMPAQPPQRHL